MHSSLPPIYILTHLFLLLNIHSTLPLYFNLILGIIYLMTQPSIQTKTFLCQVCSKEFCFDHLTQHDLIQNDLNQFKQNLLDLKSNSTSIEQIDQWENDSILKIKEKANEYRQILINYANESMHLIEQQSNSFVNEISIRFPSMSKFSQTL